MSGQGKEGQGTTFISQCLLPSLSFWPRATKKKRHVAQQKVAKPPLFPCFAPLVEENQSPPLHFGLPPLCPPAHPSNPSTETPHQDLSVPWSLRPRNRAAAATCGRDRCELLAIFNCGPRGATGGVKPGSGVQRFWGPLRASEFDPSFQQFGVSETPSQRPLRAPERLSGPRGRLFRGLGEVCPFSKERGKKVGYSEASKRPRFPRMPHEGVPTLGFPPQATDKM